MTTHIYEGDCLEVMKGFERNSFDAIVTDPPYGLKFMGKEWDHGIPGIPFWQEALRVSKPGTHMLAFGGTRTHHRLMVAIEDTGWEIRDTLMWVYGSGFPKSLDVSKAIDKAAGVERVVIGKDPEAGRRNKATPRFNGTDYAGGVEWQGAQEVPITAPTTDAAKQWDGWGTALKPAYEIIILCRKPLEGTVAENVQKWGTGGINIDGCRVEYLSESDKASATPQGECTAKSGALAGKTQHDGNRSLFQRPEQKGRFPANLIHDGSDEVLGLFPYTKTGDTTPIPYTNTVGKNVFSKQCGIKPELKGDSGSAARYFYCAKASPSERNLGLLEGTKNTHPTVKPLALLQYLCRLITPPNGVVLDPFAGSGSTGVAATREGFESVLIEIDKDYVEIAKARNIKGL